ncbi:PD-(D/E)XK nuclease family protein [Pectobacterium peruviense]|uniref:RecB family exonuclease n=1 Tax=Pectobacterium peruviense TaxID=2066479 RepID=UPI0016700662|nr:PD-(D/E)XK nuclease family protein [Pectobacterium peruviense]
MTLERTRPALPSKLGVFITCPMRYLLESEQHSFRCLPLPPQAVLGSAVHRLANTLQKRSENDPESIIQRLENDVVATLIKTQQGTLALWVWEHYGIAGLVSRQALIKYIRYAKSLVPPVAGRVGHLPDMIKMRDSIIPIGREKLLKSICFDMLGRADLIYRKETGQIRVVDFKTGEVRDEKKQPKEEYLLQIAAYGMMVKELAPDINIELELAGMGDSWTGVLDNSLQECVNRVLVSFNEILPRNTSFSALNIAQPSGHCVQCAGRCSCPVYSKNLCHFMQQPCPGDRHFSIDIHGRLLEVEMDNNFTTLRLLLPDGYMAKVFHIPTRFIPESNEMIGSDVTLYGLNVFGDSSENKIPRNFYVVDTQEPRRSAFQFCLQWKKNH